MISYSAKIKKDKDGYYIVSFPDLEGCLTYGESFEEAKEMAREALSGWLAASCDMKLAIPDPKIRSGKDFYKITAPIQIVLPIYLRKLRKRKNWTQSQVAKKLGISQQAYAKYESPKYSHTLDQIQKILDNLPISLEISI
jgi:antitoxin HicB